MPISVQCDACGRAYQLKDQFAGQTVQCPNCNAAIHTPAEPSADPPISQSIETPLMSPPLVFEHSQPVSLASAAISGGGSGVAVGGFGESAPSGAFGMGAPAAAPSYAGPPLYDYGSEYANFAFNRDKFLLRQKVMAISAKYYVWDEQGRSILFVQRPAHLFRNLIATLFGLVAAFAVFILFVGVFGTLAAATQTDWIMYPGFILGIPAAIVAFIGGFTLLCKKRHVTIYQDDTKQTPLFQIFQDKKIWFLNATYTVADMQGRMLARFHKNYLYNILRKRWVVSNPQGEIICLAKEDSILKGLIRRFLTKLLVTNFIIVAPHDDSVLLGEFNRKFTLLDRYVLDMTPDWQRQLDRRVALALGIMLDTGESR